VPRDTTEALALYKQGCDMGVADSCTSQADLERKSGRAGL
jgi:hypothetical protein